jgi:hypothetical protein
MYKRVSTGAKNTVVSSRFGKQLPAPVFDAQNFPKNIRSASYLVCGTAPRIVRGAPAGLIHLLNFLKMFNLFFAIFLAFACPKHADKPQHGGTTVTVQNDTGGEGEHIPPGPKP